MKKSITFFIQLSFSLVLFAGFGCLVLAGQNYGSGITDSPAAVAVEIPQAEVEGAGSYGGKLIEEGDEQGPMRRYGKIFVVVGVLLIMFLGIALYLIFLDRKLARLERRD